MQHRFYSQNDIFPKSFHRQRFFFILLFPVFIAILYLFTKKVLTDVFLFLRCSHTSKRNISFFTFWLSQSEIDRKEKKNLHILPFYFYSMRTKIFWIIKTWYSAGVYGCSGEYFTCIYTYIEKVKWNQYNGWKDFEQMQFGYFYFEGMYWVEERVADEMKKSDM